MNEDKFLKDLLSDYHPQLSDDNAFMQRLQRQMELIEEVKAYQRAESRKNKLMSLKLLAVGVVLGCIVTLASFTLPTIFDRYINGTQSEFNKKRISPLSSFIPRLFPYQKPPFFS